MIIPRPLKRVLGKIIPFSQEDKIPTFNLGSGTANSTTYLRGDGTWAAVSGGSGGLLKGTASGVDTYTTTITGVASYTDGDAYLIRFTTGNTTGCSLNINSLGAKTLYKNNDGVLIGGDIVNGAEMLCVYNSTLNGFQVIGTSPNTLISYVTNAESVTITKGQPVYAFGGTGDRLRVKLAYNTSDATSAQTVGFVMSPSIAANQKGFIIVSGLLDGLSILPTSTYADGDAIYLGATAGSITNVKPVAPNHMVYLGFVTTASNGSAGRMYVRVQNGYELQELHNVAITTPANGQVLQYESATSLWKNATPSSGALTVGTTAIASGTVGRVLFQGTGNVLQQDAGFLFDATAKTLTNYGKGGFNSNTSFGVTAGQSNVSGIQNSFFGFETLTNNQTGSFNTAMGYTALRNTTGIGYNTAIGWGAGVAITSGHTNTLLGYGAGTGITTGNSNTIIGVNIATLAAGTTNNVILADGGGNIAIRKDANHFVGVGYSATATLGARLDVRAQGALSTDIAFRVRNSADAANLFTLSGNNQFSLANSVASDGFTTYLGTPSGVTQITASGNGLVLTSNFSSSLNATNNTAIQTNGTTRIYCNNTGNVGIGSATTLGARLDVRGQGALSTDIAFRVRNSADTANLFSVQGDGYQNFLYGKGNVMNLGAAPETSNTHPYLKIYNGGSTAQSFAAFYNDAGVALSIGAGRNIVNGFNDTGSYTNAYGTFMGLASASTYPTSRQYQAGVCGFTPFSQGTNDSGWAQTGADTSGNNAMYVNYIGKNWTLGGTSQGNGKAVLSIINNTAPSTNITDAFQQYSADIVAGNAAPHFRTENGSIIKLYQQATGGAASTFVTNTSGILNDTATFDGYTIGQVVKALRNCGILA